MKEQINNVIEWIKQQPIQGCITGSCLLDYFEGQDVDVFTYTEKSFTKLFYSMYFNPMFQILDSLEQWKSNKFMNEEMMGLSKLGLVTIKFTYNTCVSVNIIYKKQGKDIFSILSSFDMDIICKGYDIQTKTELDLTGESTITKITGWNKWNTNFYNTELWQASKLLRQLERCFKYHKRGYNTDAVVLKYIEIIDNILDLHDIFKSINYTEKLKQTKNNLKIVKDICNIWLNTHDITEEEIELLQIKIKEI